MDLDRLAEVIANTVKGVRPAKPQLRLAEPPKTQLFDAITREACFRRIRFLRKAYRLACIVDQHCFNVPAMECLEDAQVSALLADMERARECLLEGISLDEAGLIRTIEAPVQDKDAR